MPRTAMTRLLAFLLLCATALAGTGCDDDAPQHADDLTHPDTDPGDTDTGEPQDAGDTAETPDTTGDTDASDSHTTNLDIAFDIDYDARDSEADTTSDLADAEDSLADSTDAADDSEVPDWSGPPTQFDDLEELRDEALRTALLERIDEHNALGYDAARDAMYDADSGIDVHDGLLECVYTGALAVPDGTNTPGGTHNTEHSWPQSAGASTEPARSDLHHLFPVTQTSNSIRGSIPYGDTGCDQSAACTWYEGGSELGPSSINGTSVFEVRPEHRGDIARAHFYFAVRYQHAIAIASESPLRQWHQQDPPDDLERARNDAIETLQQNRNPFVDRPDFVGHISDF